MSKLDYVTIAIVAVCILAIVFFVYKMTDLFGDQTGTTNIETVSDPVETEDDVYDPSVEDSDETEEDLNEEETGTADSDQENAPATNDEDLEEEEENLDASTSEGEDDDEEDSSSDDSASPEPSYGSTGKYMVIAGTYAKKDNANQAVNRLKRLGYDNARVEIFDRGKYALVMVDRFSTMSSAERLITSLKKDGVKSYVKTKE